MSYDLCSSRHCNVCLMEETDTVRPTNPVNDDAKGVEIALRHPILRKCNGCQLVLYCNTEHQKMDWRVHRDLCRAAAKIMTIYNVKHPYLINGQPKNADEMERCILQVKYLLRVILGRSLLYHEEELTSFPQYCQVCFSFGRTVTCARCVGVSYCSESHAQEDREKHFHICGLLQLYYSPYKTLSMRPTIFEFYRRVPDLHKTDLFEAFQRATLKRLPERPIDSLKSYQMFSTVADFSCIGTICYALSFTEMRCYENNKFIIFIVGATFEQQLWFQDLHTKFFFLQFPQISLLCLFFIGPDSESEDGKDSKESEYVFQGQERFVQYITFRGLFQEFTKQHNIKPSLIISYNCGFSENMHDFHNEVEYVELGGSSSEEKDYKSLNSTLKKNTWAQGISEILLTFDAPIVFTSFTNLEANFDYATVLRIAKSDKQSIRVSRILNVKQNPFRDLRPLRYWRINDNDEIYYRNGYVQALRTQFES